MSALDVLFIGRLFDKGIADFFRIVAVTGSEIDDPHYVRTRIGASIASITQGMVKAVEYEQRYISGNVLTGVKTDADGYIGATHSQITVIPEGNNYDEFLGWASLNPHKYSTSHSYFSWLLGKKKIHHRCQNKGRRTSHYHVGRIRPGFPDGHLPGVSYQSHFSIRYR